MSNPNPSPATRFKPGNRGRPPNLGLSVLEWWNQLQEKTRPELEVIATSPAAPINKAVAAAQLFRAHRNITKVGDMGGADLDRVLDLALGRPQQVVSVGQLVTHKVYISPSRLPREALEAGAPEWPPGIIDPTDLL